MDSSEEERPLKFPRQVNGARRFRRHADLSGTPRVTDVAQARKRKREKVAQANTETMKTCLSCPLCDNLLSDSTTISECLHTFCRKCIYGKIMEEKIECCPVCNMDLGNTPLNKLRPDQNLQDLRAKIFPVKRIKVKIPGSISVPVCSGLDEHASKHILQEFSGLDSEQDTMLSNSCPEMSNMGLLFLVQESEELKRELATVSDKLLATEEGMKELEAEGKLAQERLQEIDSLSSELAEKEEKLTKKEKELKRFRKLAQTKSKEAAELKSRLDWLTSKELRTKKKELEIFQMLVQTKSEETADLKKLDWVTKDELKAKQTELEIFQMLAKAKSEEVVELKTRLDRVTFPSSTPSKEQVSLESYKKLSLEKEELKKDMGLIELAARMTTAYQMCLRWEKKGGLDMDLPVMAKQYWEYRECVEKQGNCDHFPSLEKYQKEWKDDAVHAPEKAPSDVTVTEPGLVPFAGGTVPPPSTCTGDVRDLPIEL